MQKKTLLEKGKVGSSFTLKLFSYRIFLRCYFQRHSQTEKQISLESVNLIVSITAIYYLALYKTDVQALSDSPIQFNHSLSVSLRLR